MTYVRDIVVILIVSIGFELISQPNISNNELLSHEQAQEIVKEKSSKCWKLREEDPLLALNIGLETLELASEHKITDYLPRLNNYIGVIYIHYLFDVKNSFPYFHNALTLSLQNNDSVQIAFSYNNLGDAFMLSGNVPLALQHTSQSIEIFESLNHLNGIAYGYYNLGLVYRVKGDYDSSVYYLKKARDIRHDMHDSIGYASVLMDLAKTYEVQGLLDDAMKTYQESYDCHRKINNDTYTAYCLNGMGSIYYLKENYDLAYEKFKASLEINLSNNYYFGLIDVYLNLALVYARLGDIEKGEDVLYKAQKYAHKIGYPSKIVSTHKTYAEFYQILKKYKKASESFGRFIALNDSILSEQQFETLNQLQKNHVMQQNLKDAKSSLLAQKKDRYYLIIIIILMIFLIFMIGLKLLSQFKMNAKLQEVNSTKDKMFSVISHDLRSPFNSLLGFTDLLIEDLKLKKYNNADKYAVIIHSATRETLNLLNNLLTWSRSQTGKIHFTPHEFLVNTLFNDLNSLFKIDSSENNIKLLFKNNIDEKIFADQTILMIILTNLISNALKYTPSEGEVVVSAEKKQQKISFTVSDTGIGISDDILSSILTTNKNIESKTGVRNEKGTGLGLTICKDLISRHNGTLYAENKTGKGSIFSFEIPADKQF